MLRCCALRLTMSQIAQLAVFGLLTTTGFQSWSSDLFRFQNGRYMIQPVIFKGRTYQLLDFSYVGYENGEKAIASNIPAYRLTVNTTGSFSDNLATAIG